MQTQPHAPGTPRRYVASLPADSRPSPGASRIGPQSCCCRCSQDLRVAQQLLLLLPFFQPPREVPQSRHVLAARYLLAWNPILRMLATRERAMADRWVCQLLPAQASTPGGATTGDCRACSPPLVDRCSITRCPPFFKRHPPTQHSMPSFHEGCLVSVAIHYSCDTLSLKTRLALFWLYHSLMACEVVRFEQMPQLSRTLISVLLCSILPATHIGRDTHVGGSCRR